MCEGKSMYYKRYVWMINFFVIFCCYGVFLQKHFSVDSYSIIYDNSGKQYLMQGRVVSYILNLILNKFNINTTLNQQALTFSLILCISLSVTILIDIIYRIWENKNFINILAINVLVLISFLNVFLLEWYLYPEITLFLAIGLITTVMGILTLSISDNLLNSIISFIFILISMEIYQANLGIFIIYSLIICFIKNKGDLNKKSIFSSIKILLIGGITSIINIFILKYLVYTGIAPRSDRDPTLNFELIKNNFYGILQDQKNIWINTYDFLPKYVLTIYFMAIVILIIYSIKKKNLNKKTFIYLVCISIISYLIIFVPHLFTNDLWIAQRTIISFFILLTFGGLVALFFNNNDVNKNLVLIIVSVFFLIINYIYIQSIASNHIASNKIDQQFSVIINNEIEKYEKENNIKINNIAAQNDIEPTYHYKNIKYCIYDTNVRAFVTPWANVNMINYYSNNNYNKVEMDSEIYNQYFKSKNWDEFIPEEQMVFKGDTLYLIIY